MTSRSTARRSAFPHSSTSTPPTVSTLRAARGPGRIPTQGNRAADTVLLTTKRERFAPEREAIAFLRVLPAQAFQAAQMRAGRSSDCLNMHANGRAAPAAQRQAPQPLASRARATTTGWVRQSGCDSVGASASLKPALVGHAAFVAAVTPPCADPALRWACWLAAAVGAAAVPG
jgi:hypothetical protein